MKRALLFSVACLAAIALVLGTTMPRAANTPSAEAAKQLSFFYLPAANPPPLAKDADPAQVPTAVCPNLFGRLTPVSDQMGCVTAALLDCGGNIVAELRAGSGVDFVPLWGKWVGIAATSASCPSRIDPVYDVTGVWQYADPCGTPVATSTPTASGPLTYRTGLLGKRDRMCYGNVIPTYELRNCDGTVQLILSCTDSTCGPYLGRWIEVGYRQHMDCLDPTGPFAAWVVESILEMPGGCGTPTGPIPTRTLRPTPTATGTPAAEVCSLELATTRHCTLLHALNDPYTGNWQELFKAGLTASVGAGTKLVQLLNDSTCPPYSDGRKMIGGAVLDCVNCTVPWPAIVTTDTASRITRTAQTRTMPGNQGDVIYTNVTANGVVSIWFTGYQMCSLWPDDGGPTPVPGSCPKTLGELKAMTIDNIIVQELLDGGQLAGGVGRFAADKQTKLSECGWTVHGDPGELKSAWSPPDLRPLPR